MLYVQRAQARESPAAPAAGLYGDGLNGNADVLAFRAWQTVNSGSGLWCVLLFAASIVIVLKIPITDKIVLVPGAASLGP